MRQMKMLKRNIFSLALAVIVAVSGLTVTPVVTNAAVTAPASLKFVENDDATCTISWNAVSGATEYHVYEAVSRYATYKMVDTVTETSYTDADYNGGYYKVTAVAGGTESPKSAATSYEIEVFGYNTNIFEETDNAKEIQTYVDDVFKNMERGQFSSDRYAHLFKPGTYKDLVVKIGFYTQVAGLGYSPEDVVMNNIKCPAEWMVSKKYDGTINFNALCNFWRSVENVTTTDQNTMWAVSQATSMRRMNIKGSLELHEQGGYASGGFLADSKVAGRTYQSKNNKTGKMETREIGISAGSQQQWLSRNVETNAWDGNVWNYVFVGSEFDSLLDDTNTVKPN